MASKLLKINKNFQITLPAKLRKRLALKEGDYLEAELRKNTFVFKPKKVIDVDPDQAWFWSDEWQKKEREADEAIAKGDVIGPFDNIHDALKALKNHRKV